MLRADGSAPHVGVLAVQGAFARHQQMLETLGATTIAVRQPAHLEGVDALVIPGGESTTISMQLERTGLFEPIAALLDSGMAVFGTCAGLILLATKVTDGRLDQRQFGAIDLTVQRNGYGRQTESFETDIQVTDLQVTDIQVTDSDAGGVAGGVDPGGDGSHHHDHDAALHAVFIRAPKIIAVGSGVEVLATVDDHPVLCRHDRVLVAAFHPELTDDHRLHRRFLATVTA